jgi:hypothetical protein
MSSSLILTINHSLSSYFPGLRIVDTCGNIQFTSSRILSLGAEYNLINFIANKNDVGNNTGASKRVSQNFPQKSDGKIITLSCGYCTSSYYVLIFVSKKRRYLIFTQCLKNPQETKYLILIVFFILFLFRY